MCFRYVMALAISEFELVLSVILAFIAGMGGLYLFLKIYPLIISRRQNTEPSNSERLEYYEKQLIDIKIRLDAMEIQGVEPKPDKSLLNDRDLDIQRDLEKVVKEDIVTKPDLKEVEPEIDPKKQQFVPKIDISHHTNPIDIVLHLITEKRMTSRDIQITLDKSREHTSRLMKKLFDEGYVQRHRDTRPFTYSITEKGLEKIGKLQVDTQIV